MPIKSSMTQITYIYYMWHLQLSTRVFLRLLKGRNSADFFWYPPYTDDKYIKNINLQSYKLEKTYKAELSIKYIQYDTNMFTVIDCWVSIESNFVKTALQTKLWKTLMCNILSKLDICIYTCYYWSAIQEHYWLLSTYWWNTSPVLFAVYMYMYM